MRSIPIPARAETHPHLRPLNVLRDLPQVADLIELCFHHNMDHEGETYVREMRRASQDSSWVRSVENASSMPLTGFVWEQDGKIIGNASLIVFRRQRKKTYMLANVATHPDHRHRGIGRAVTETAVAHAREHGADELWLNVRDDNPDAIDLYTDLGFREHSRRTQWQSSDPPTSPNLNGFQIVPRQSRFWPAQQAWLDQNHPNELAWYRAWNFKGLAPGLWNWLYLLFVDMNLRQWAALRDDSLQAILSWTPNGGRHEPLWLALGADSAPEAATHLLVHARRELGRRRFILEHPAGRVDESIRAAGFVPLRTLIWMRAEGATK
ncbi:MAG: GNAT family N-acetyltransferase [Anaerolineaceae bacterium]|nr:MAG: GNAT family N-acetyltransferase [Anaerolineaceae bacterium]